MIKYRPDIDGLRAIAVVPVVLFHAHIGFLRGGFVGVDVFFVISGFLITLLILGEMEAGRFTVASFYQRRILRIFPALLIVMAFTAVAGWLIFLPDDYRRLGASLVATSTFLSNVYFWKDTGYFGATPETKPLLHTWSLSIEEQFYVLYPLYLLLICRLARSTQVAITGAFWLASLLLSIAGVFLYPVATFFFLPTRMWELLTGALLAMRVLPAPARGPVVNALSCVGLVLIVATAFIYHEATPFPGAAAVLPVLGTALLIWAGSTGALNRALSADWLVFIGKISYPLYLWHFPLFGFALYLSIGPLPIVQLLALVALSFLLAALTWRFVELPIRSRGRIASPAKVIAIGCAAMCVAGGAGGITYMMTGFEGRFAGDRLMLVRGMTDWMPEARRCMNPTPRAVSVGGICVFGSGTEQADTLVWGDSFVETLAPGILAAASREKKRFVMAGQYGCTPLFVRPVAGETPRGNCADHNDAVLSLLTQREDIKKVLLAFRWPRETGTATDITNVAGLSAEIDLLLKRLTALGKTVWVVGPIPVVKFNVPRALYVQSLGFSVGAEIRPQRAEFDSNYGWVTEFLAQEAGNPNIHIIEIDRALCDDLACQVADGNHSLYFDYFHLTTYGAKLVSDRFEPIFR